MRQQHLPPVKEEGVQIQETSRVPTDTQTQLKGKHFSAAIFLPSCRTVLSILATEDSSFSD